MLVCFGCGITSLLSSMGWTWTCSWIKIVKIFILSQENLPISSIVGNYYPSVSFTQITSWLKLSDFTEKTFSCGWIDIQFHLKYILDCIHPTSGCKVAIIWPKKTSCKIHKLIVHVTQSFCLQFRLWFPVTSWNISFTFNAVLWAWQFQNTNFALPYAANNTRGKILFGDMFHT